jgi:hypothetical protein
MNLRTIQRSFAGGEMSPSMFARVDDVRFQNGYAQARNFEVLPNGSLRRRPGLRHIRRCKYNDKRARVIPFTHSINDTLQIEMGHQYFRFHQNGGTVLYATPYVVASVDVAGNTIKFTAAHGLATGTSVQFTSSTRVAADLPDPLAPQTVYTITVIDAKSIRVNTVTLLPDTGAGTIYMWLDSAMPIDWFSLRNFVDAAIDLSDDRISLASPHGFVTGDAIRFVTTGTLPTSTPAFTPSTTYYVIFFDVNQIQVATTLANALAGTRIDMTVLNGGAHTIYRLYSVGDLVFSSIGGHGVFYCIADVADSTVPSSDVAHWHMLPVDGPYEIPHPYIESNLGAVGYDQSNDIIYLAHDDHLTAELRREGALRWIYAAVTFAPQLAPPTIGTVTETYGTYMTFDAAIGDLANPSIFTAVSSVSNGHGLQVGDSVYVENTSGTIGGGVAFPAVAAALYPAGYYEVMRVEPGTPPFTKIRLKTVNGGDVIFSDIIYSVYIRYASVLTDTTQTYKVTAVTEDGLESQPSGTAIAVNNLSVAGSSNLVSWSAVTGAAGYYVYKLRGATYGFIGRSDTGVLTFKDDNIAPDLGRSLATLDTSLNAGSGNSPAAVASFEQRRFFAGTDNSPNGVWATRSGTETDLSYHIPVLDDDRLKFEIASREAVAIRHLVPMQQLLVLTNSTEFRIVPVNSESLTPSSIDAKVQSYQGCSVVRPVVVSNNLVFCAARGGHVFEMGYQPQGGGLSTPGDVCLRAEHLFDGHTIEDQAHSKAPHQIVWFCSPSSSLLLGLTYVPQEQIGAWHAHDTAAGGVFESCSVAAEGVEDVRYYVVKRTINGSTVRSIEVMSTEAVASLTSAYFVDAGGSFNGTYVGSTNDITVTGGTTWTYGNSVTITADEVTFVLGSDDVGDQIVLTSAGVTYRIRITAVSTNKIATGTLLATLPTALRSAPTTAWAFARDAIGGLDHLEGQTVQILGDGLVQATKVVASGAITLATPAVAGCVGLGMPSYVRLLPIGLPNVEAWGQGRTKNVNQAAIRVVRSGEFLIGPNDTSLAPANTEAVAGSLVTGEARVTLPPDWTSDGQIVMRIEDPLPMTILGTILQVSLGD